MLFLLRLLYRRKFHIKIRCACGSWIKEDDEKVIDYLTSVEEMPAPEIIAETVGLPVRKVYHTLRMLNQQARFLEGRRRFLADCK